jgi:hypothetical protein
MCGEPRNGLEVREDWVINTIRAFKRNVTKNEKNYRLVVCKECYPKYAKAKSRYDKRRMIYITLGVVFGIIVVLAASFRPTSFVVGIAAVCIMYLLSLLSYTPALIMPKLPDGGKAHLHLEKKKAEES